MLCVIAFIVFGFLSIFSVKYKSFAKDAFDCVFRRVTLRPCNTGFDQRLKVLISSWFLKRNEKAGKLIFKNFELLSWFFVILSLASLIYTARSAYLYAKFGSCDPKDPGACIINQIGGEISPIIKPSIPASTPTSTCENAQ